MCFADVLRDEMKEILGEDLTTTEQVDGCGTDLGALCLSGGGIRSATFALGVMQGLARFRLLDQFHYLSSVSGGGYIASWLSRWRQCANDDEVFKALNVSVHTGVEPPQITGIRADSNYITPQLGLLSADTWTVIALYLRNLLLNWILFVPFFMGCLVAPRLCASVLDHLSRNHGLPGVGLSPEEIFDGLRFIGGILAFVGLSCAIHGRFRREDPWLTNSNFRLKVLLPLLVSGALFSAAAVLLGACKEADFAKEFFRHYDTVAPIWGAGLYLIAWLVGRLSSWKKTRQPERKIEWDDVGWWTVSGAVVGLLVAVGMIQIAGAVSSLGPRGGIEVAVVLGLSGFMLAYLAGELLYVGLASFSAKGEMDREWLARSSGWISAVVVGCATISAVALYAPEILRCWRGWTLSSGAVSGFLTLALGSSGRTGATQAAQALKNIPLKRIASGAAIIFAVLIASLLALFNESLESDLINPKQPWLSAAAVDIYLLVGPIVFAAVVSRFINVNRFSLHALYRNRLVRAFLGSARTDDRKADPFTGFDPADNPPLASVKPKGPDRSLFHVINAALNVVSSKKKPAWQERKAESFTMTRLHCGNPNVQYRPTRVYGGASKGGLSLGTAMAISGAAVSPNQGYNSSPLIGFLLMLFNVRLGWWLGCPRNEEAYYREGPEYSLTPALRELAGDTTDDSKWIYLSDGGHFENLGLYEMVRRRCRRIVVSDAGYDPNFSFEDLGNAVRKIYIDFGVSISFEKLEIKARHNPPVPGLRFAIGTIDYPGSSRQGWLLYLKPTYMGTTERADIRSYASASPSFPHESTTDQWFSESQLEAYRALGANIAEYICSGGKSVDPGAPPTKMTLDRLMQVAAGLYEKVSHELGAQNINKPESSR
jgi:hypothetical protein